MKNLVTRIFTLFCFAILSSALTAEGIDVNDTKLYWKNWKKNSPEKLQRPPYPVKVRGK